MSRVVLIEATPRTSAGVQQTVRLAGGGSRGYTQLGHSDWRAGVVAEPRFTGNLGFGEGGWTKGGVATVADLVFSPASAGLASSLAGYMWLDAAITIRAGEEASGVFATRLVGTVAQQSLSGGALTLSPADLSVALSDPVAPGTFAGTGGLEGSSNATGRVKRRSFGRVFNVEGLLLDGATNVYEFGDTGRPLAAIVAVRDKGRSGPLNILGWQGTAQLTLNVLKAATPPAGGATIAPSIACAKWWTSPSGPLTADLEGEIGAGYAETPGDLAAALVAGSGVALADVAGAAALRTVAAGIHIGSGTETIAEALDRLLLNVSLLWVLSAAGTIEIHEWTWTAPIETLTSSRVARTAVYRPVGSRTLGYQKNERIQSDGEIAADLDDLASDAASDAAAALARIAVIDSDGWLSAGEKPEIIRLVTAFTAEAPVLAGQAGRLGIVAELATLQAAKAALDTYLAGLSPAWNDTGHDTAIVAATFQGRFTDYEYARTVLVTKIADVASTRATWGNITGTEAVTVPIAINAQAIIEQALRQDDAQRVLDARTFVDGQPVNGVFATFRDEQIDTNEVLESSLTLLGAKTSDGTAWNLALDSVHVSPTQTLAEKFSEIGADNGDVSATVQELKDVVLGPDGSATARAILKVDANGNLAGIFVTSTNSGPSSIGLLAGVTTINAPDGTLLASFQQDGDGAYIPRLKVDTLKTNTAMVPVRVVSATHVAGTFSGSGTASPRTAQLTASVTVPTSGWVEITAKLQQGLVGTDGPWAAAIALNGSEDGYSIVGGGVEQDSIATQGSFYLSAAGTYTITLGWAAGSGIELRERSIFIKFFPFTG